MLWKLSHNLPKLQIIPIKGLLEGMIQPRSGFFFRSRSGLARVTNNPSLSRSMAWAKSRIIETPMFSAPLVDEIPLASCSR